jgi:hypothetical protein
MLNTKEKFVLDENGNKIEVILSYDYYKSLLSEIEEKEELKAYDKAKSKNDEILDFDAAMIEIGL